MVDILGTLGLSGFSFGVGTLGTILIWVVGVVFFFILIGGGIIWFIWNKSYNQIVELWAQINGVDQVIATYKAKWIRLPGTMKRLLYIRGASRWESPQYMTGKNVWKFHRRKIDGQWHNFMHSSVDEKLNAMGIEHVQGDIRMQSAANEKNLRDRFQKKKDWLGLITQIAYIITFILIFISLVVLFSKLIDISESLKETAGAIGKMADSVDRFYAGKVDGQSPVGNDRGDTGVLTPALMLPVIGGIY